MTRNNREYHVESLTKSSQPQNQSGYNSRPFRDHNNTQSKDVKPQNQQSWTFKGFQFAIQQDGKSLGESLWRQNNINGEKISYFFSSASNPPCNSSKIQMRLSEIDSAVQTSMNQFKKLSTTLPPRPKVTNIIGHHNTIVPKSHDTSFQTINRGIPSQDPLTKKEIETRNNLANTKIVNPYITKNNKAGNSSDIHNPYAPANKSPSNLRSQQFQNNRTNILQEQRAPSISSGQDDACQKVLFNQNSKANERELNDLDNAMEFDYDEEPHPIRSVTPKYTSQSIQSLPQDANYYKNDQQPTNSETFNEFGDDDDDFFANLDVDKLIEEHKQQQNQQTDKSSNSISNYDHESLPENDGNTWNTPSNNNNNKSESGSYNQNNTITSCFAPDPRETTSHYTLNNDDVIFSDGNTPLCPGHSRPCITLTANTSNNMGRQFYKCSLPEGEKCEFFQWVDGQDNNTSYNPTDYGNTTGRTGTVKNIYSENRRKFGHHSFRAGQKVVIEAAIKNKDVFVLMPTGGGKSLCYQLPAWCCPGLSVVISPLLSLIEDQVQSMTKLGVKAVFLSSSQDFDTQQREVLDDLRVMSDHGGIKLLYITPEKLRHSNVVQGILRDLDRKGLISRFVIDEAHCLR